MSLRIKICGFTSARPLEAAVEAGADAIGFVFHPASPRYLPPAEAAQLAGRLPAGVLSVAVTLDPGPADLAEILQAFSPDVLQGDAEALAALDLPPGIATWPVFRSGAVLPASLPPRLLFEGARSGTGERADWSAAAALAGRCELILGGGLDPDNVGEAIRQVRPWAVDVSSGVEVSRGHKDPDRIRAFIRAARAAAGDR
ncbi:MAG: phosphoribosylanthranilate isomerase [Steroidobacteraceae bacterium]